MVTRKKAEEALDALRRSGQAGTEAVRQIRDRLKMVLGDAAKTGVGTLSAKSLCDDVDELCRLAAPGAALLEAAKQAADWIERNRCTHEETHRGGVLWTICDSCGKKWADDRGGFQPEPELAFLDVIRKALEAAPGEGRTMSAHDRQVCEELQRELAAKQAAKPEVQKRAAVIAETWLETYKPSKWSGEDLANLSECLARAMEEWAMVTAPEREADIGTLNEDVFALCRAAGIGDHVRPTSCHRVVRDEVIPAIETMRKERDALMVPEALKKFGGVGWEPKDTPFFKDIELLVAGVGERWSNPADGGEISEGLSRLKGAILLLARRIEATPSPRPAPDARPS